MSYILRSALTAVAIMVSATGAHAAEKLAIYHWFEYIPQSLLDKFSQETGIEVVMDTYDSNESMLATLKAGALGTYDIAVPTDYMVSILLSEGMLDEIAEGERKNLGNVKAQFADPAYDPGLKHSIPYQWGTTSFAVDTAVYPGDINTTDIIFNPPEMLKGRINMIDSQGEVLALAALHMGIPQCIQDREKLKALNAMLQTAKPYWASFNSDTAKEVLASGDVAVGMIFNGYAAKARGARPSLQYAFPKEGYVLWMDSVVLLKDAPNRDNAIKFMDFLLKPENIAQVSNFARYGQALSGAEPYLDKALTEEPESNPPENGNGVFVQACDAQTQTVYDRMWTNLRK
ncbi:MULTISPECIES: extracellular solute-binding protein [Grimontia]|uniref:Putrescine-binding periplasmic protein n=1 Tax=Grimontia marina TaxID=646534 RepID=A0A128FGC3_9GAMM|nr:MULTISPECIES: extracellular solute-binding protein [Grimontia]WRW00846.1 extracellular solute-binding protein [Grimontia sp. NTOU-MAR1]CZF85842.1 Spermidine/putrescine-binding periplasmic protein precursor [Grimontia marina]